MAKIVKIVENLGDPIKAREHVVYISGVDIFLDKELHDKITDWFREGSEADMGIEITGCSHLYVDNQPDELAAYTYALEFCKTHGIEIE